MDEIDAANELAQHITNMAIQAALSRQLRTLSNGICRSCGQPIKPERLRVHPFASACCDCAAEEEEERLRAKKAGQR